MNSNDNTKSRDVISINGVDFTHEDIFKVVDTFYTRVQEDSLLKVPFQSVHDWPEHIQRLTHFWWIRLGGRSYMNVSYNPVLKHFEAGFNAEFLKRWLELFHQTLKENLREDQANLWILISEKMGQALTMKNEFYKQEYGNKP